MRLGAELNEAEMIAITVASGEVGALLHKALEHSLRQPAGVTR
jgi:hypothetical protein